MLTDAAAIVLALVATRLAARPPKGGYTYGLKRAEILSAQANGLGPCCCSAGGSATRPCTGCWTRR